MNAQAARNWAPNDFADDNVYVVMKEAADKGEASFYVERETLYYHDPYFSSTDHPVSAFRYNSEIGLHTI